MTSREAVLALLPKSVLSRLTRKCETVREAVLTTNVARAAAGPKGALIAALECYKIPVQLTGGCTLEDLLWYIDEMYDGVFRRGEKGPDWSASGNGTYRSQRNVTSKLTSSVFRAKCMELNDKLTRTPRLPPVEDSDDLSEFQRYSSGCWWKGAVRDTLVFPKKQNKKVVKQNLRFDHVWKDVRDRYGGIAMLAGTDKSVLADMYNDEAVGWLIWMCGAFANLGVGAVALCSLAAKKPEVLKTLNTYVKALGLQKTGWGCDVCELLTLSGRGVNVDPPGKDVRTRVNKELFLKEKAAVCDISKLKHHIRAVLKEELAATPAWGPVEDYWTRRWMYTKSGSHSRYPEERILGERLDLPERPTRREFAEVVEECVIATGEPRVDAGHSYKEEHGKTRHIYSCDTASYYTFDYLLRPLEKVWRNKNVLLDPGRELQSSRYQRLAAKGGCRYMLDFDDFNSQHTIEAMRAVFEIACEGAPPEVVKWAVESWSNMYVHWLSDDGMHEMKMVGSLPSGHRATTFVNTILNAAYCRYASRNGMAGLEGYHCGDDVVIFGQEWRISEYVNDMLASPFRVNPSKQSVGFEVGEFLRVCFWETEASGYGARGVSSMVSGNWVTDTLLDKKSYVETLLRGLWTICTRFKNAGLGVVALTSLKYRVPEVAGIAQDLVLHRVSWNGTPIAGATDGRGVKVFRVRGGEAVYESEKLVAHNATQDFLDNHIDFVMLEASGYTAGQVASIMRKASVKPRTIKGETPLTYESEESNAWAVSEYNSLAALAARRDVGRDEALNILQMLLTKVEWYKLVGLVRNVTPTAYGVTGTSPWPLLCTYNAPMADLMSLRQRVSCTTAVLATYPVRV